MSDSLTEQQVAELPEHLEVEEGAAATSPKAGLFRFAQMTGSSIAGRDAAGWVTDFLNAAYYRRSVQERDVDDLRLAFCVLTTYWHRKSGHGRLMSPICRPSTVPSARSASPRGIPVAGR